MKIFSVHAGRVDFLTLQVESLRYFLKEPFEYYCIDNFIDQKSSSVLKQQCENLQVNYVRFSHHSLTGSAWDHAPALNSIKEITSDDCINVILDFDVFLVSEYSFLDCISGYDVAGMYQQRRDYSAEYLAPFIFVCNKNSDFSSINFSGQNGCDVGGNTQYYLKNRKVKLLKHTSALQYPGDEKCFTLHNPYNLKYGCQVLESSFIHYYRGTNWDRKDPKLIAEKTNWLIDVLAESKNRDILNHDYLEKYQTEYSHAFCFWNGTEEKFNSILNPYLY